MSLGGVVRRCVRHRVVLLVSIVLAGVLAGALPAAARADFYTPPNPLPPGKPGAVIRTEATKDYLLPGIPISAQAWLVLYRSTTATGQPTATSETVLVPTTPWRGKGRRPLIGYAVGTQGLATDCAASEQLQDGTEYEGPFIEEALSRGWALAVTDYPGLGTPGLHPYVVGRALGPAVLDGMRAALRYRADGLSSKAPLAIYGYSEGGEAAGWAMQLAPKYAPGLKILGGAVGAAPANFNAEYQYLNGGRLSFLIMYTALGMNAAYPQLDLNNYLNAAGQSFAAEMRSSCIEQAITEGQLEPTDLSAYVTSNPVSTPAWQAAFTANDLGSIPPKAPTLLGAGRNDEVMDYAASGPGLYKQWCARGANVKFDSIPPGVEHIVDAAPFSATAFAFLADRFAGKPLARAASCRSGR